MKMKRVNRIRRCRLCGCEDNFNNFLNIFDDNPELELEKKISKLLPIVVMAWDPLPHTVCDKCIDKLNSYNDFFETTLKTERFLRNLVPSAPENLESPDPVVQIMATPEKTGKECPPQNNADEAPEETNRPERTLNCFIVSPITSRESVYTCRECYRTFTKESSALTHSCVRIENCGELETIRGSREKSLPPLKIRLFCVKSGQFVCYLCRTSFEDKSDLVDHIKGHFLEGNLGSGKGKRCNKQKGKRKERCASECEDEGEPRPGRRKRKKCAERRSKKGRSEDVECRHGLFEKCDNDLNCQSSSGKETPESTTRDSETYNSEPEPEDKDDGQSIPLITLEDSDDPDEVTVLEENNRIFPTILCCAFCDKSFVTKESLVAHENKHLEGYAEINADGGFLCSFCAAIFACKKSLRAHEWGHDAERFGDLLPRILR